MIRNEAMFKLSYGLFILSAHENDKDNACIINTVTQVTDNPKRLTIAVNKNNYTCEMIEKTKKFTVSVLSQDVTFDMIKRFGFASGRDTDKFAGYNDHYRTENGTFFVCEGTNAYISCSVLEMMVALAICCEETYMDNPNIGNRTGQWFWNMVKNIL